MVRNTWYRRVVRSSFTWRLGMALALCGSVADAADLQLGEAVQNGDAFGVSLFITSQAPETVVSLQFDLHFSPAVELVDIVSGAQAVEASKMTNFCANAGGARVVVAGFNQTPIADGEVATIYLRPRDTGALPSDLELDSIVLSDPKGNQIPVDMPTARHCASPEAPEKTEGVPDPSSNGETEADPDEEAYPSATDTFGKTGASDNIASASTAYPAETPESPHAREQVHGIARRRPRKAAGDDPGLQRGGGQAWTSPAAPSAVLCRRRLDNPRFTHHGSAAARRSHSASHVERGPWWNGRAAVSFPIKLRRIPEQPVAERGRGDSPGVSRPSVARQHRRKGPASR